MSLLERIADRASHFDQERHAAARRERRQIAHVKKLMTQRVQLAVQGLESLCSLGASEAFQKLIKAHGGPVIVWDATCTSSPGGDMMDVKWTYISHIRLDAKAVEVADYSLTNGVRDKYEPCVFLRFPYGVSDPLLQALPLRRIATREPLDLNFVQQDKRLVLDYSIEILFEILVECSDPKKFQRLILKSLP